jgi:hypothetical protein
MIKSQMAEEWRSRSDTIQRDPLRIKPIADEVIAEIRRQDTGESDASVQASRLEGSIYFWLGDSEFERSDLIRAAALLLEHVALWDLYKEGAFERSDQSQSTDGNYRDR